MVKILHVRPATFGEKAATQILDTAPTLIHGKMIQGILRGQAIAMFVADLLENDRALAVEDECRWVSRLKGRMPAQSVEIGDLIVRVGHKNNIGGQLSLLLEEFFRVLIEMGGWPRVYQKHPRVLCIEV